MDLLAQLPLGAINFNMGGFMDVETSFPLVHIVSIPSEEERVIHFLTSPYCVQVFFNQTDVLQVYAGRSLSQYLKDQEIRIRGGLHWSD